MDSGNRRRIPGPAGAYQDAVRRRLDDPTNPIRRENFSFTPEFVARAMEHDERVAAEQDEDYNSALWIRALRFAGNEHPNTTLGSIARTRGYPSTVYRLAQVTDVWRL
jgi:hypothetical protein